MGKCALFLILSLTAIIHYVDCNYFAFSSNYYQYNPQQRSSNLVNWIPSHNLATRHLGNHINKLVTGLTSFVPQNTYPNWNVNAQRPPIYNNVNISPYEYYGNGYTGSINFNQYSPVRNILENVFSNLGFRQPSPQTYQGWPRQPQNNYNYQPLPPVSYAPQDNIQEAANGPDVNAPIPEIPPQSNPNFQPLPPVTYAPQGNIQSNGKTPVGNPDAANRPMNAPIPEMPSKAEGEAQGDASQPSAPAAEPVAADKAKKDDEQQYEIDVRFGDN